MAKTFNFDSKDNLQISDLKLQIVDGVEVQAGTVHCLQANQIEKHMPMFNADMVKAERDKAAAIATKLAVK